MYESGKHMPLTKCIIHGADKEDNVLFFAQRHGLYIDVGRYYLLDSLDLFTIETNHHYTDINADDI
jgi:hypothetical protein